MGNDRQFAEYDSLIAEFTKCRTNHDKECLCRLVEYVRGEGILYQDFQQKNTEFLECLLKTSLDLVNNSFNHEPNVVWWFVTQVYDIIFHQVRWENYPSSCNELYFELTKKMLDEECRDFYKIHSEARSYPDCIYFTLMDGHWFANSRQKFLLLYERLQPFMNEQPDYLREHWIKRYEELQSKES